MALFYIINENIFLLRRPVANLEFNLSKWRAWVLSLMPTISQTAPHSIILIKNFHNYTTQQNICVNCSNLRSKLCRCANTSSKTYMDSEIVLETITLIKFILMLLEIISYLSELITFYDFRIHVRIRYMIQTF